MELVNHVMVIFDVNTDRVVYTSCMDKHDADVKSLTSYIRMPRGSFVGLRCQCKADLSFAIGFIFFPSYSDNVEAVSSGTETAMDAIILANSQWHNT